jgi:predicted hotdog family 3-hydroxylacyl-ACP dehydratase
MYAIEAVIKHRKPMRLIDELLSFDSQSASVLVIIDENSEFYNSQQGGVPSYIGIEYMAQCIAAKAGANALALGETLKLGFLLGTRRYQSKIDYFSKEQPLKVTATQLMDITAGLSVFECKIVTYNSEEKCLAHAKINVFQPEDSTEYIRQS